MNKYKHVYPGNGKKYATRKTTTTTITTFVQTVFCMHRLKTYFTNTIDNQR